MPNQKKQLFKEYSFFYFVISLFFISTIYCLSYHIKQDEFPKILIGFTLSFASFLLIIKNRTSSKSDLSWLVIFTSFIPLLAFPQLSDDVFRFMWDGNLIADGISPYRYLPSDFIKLADVNIWYSATFTKLNSPNYYSIYPFVDQFIYFLSALASKVGIPFHIVMKVIFIIIHIGGFFSAKSLFNKSKTSLYLYYLNPLVIVEGISNLHAEIVMIGFFSMALNILNQNRWYLGMFLFVLTIHTKLTPLMILPFILLFLYKKKKYSLILWSLLLILLGFIPLLFDKDLASFMTSIDLYFRKFEFNGGIYNLLKFGCNLILGYNPINVVGPLLAVGLLLFFGYQFSRFLKHLGNADNLSKLSIVEVILGWAAPVLIVHMLLSTTIHPWYIIPLLFINIYRQHLYTVCWSYLAILSYLNYSYFTSLEINTVIALEYAIVFMTMIYYKAFPWVSTLGSKIEITSLEEC
jgi:alpha-1,6-mannosyltransferase